ncbi:DUF6708 domain-containing protein, partial [Pseudomonadota bacterium AL_CKDN230030165-1A_HGKHYDSX7]
MTIEESLRGADAIGKNDAERGVHPLREAAPLDTLEPPPPGCVVLPGIDEGGGFATSAHAVSKRYENGMALTDGASLMQGVLAPFGVLIVVVFGPAIYSTLHSSISWLAKLAFLPFMLLGLLVGALFILFECTGYRSQPTLFDRAAGRIYVMHAERDWLRPWRWFRTPVSFEVFEWPRMRGMIVSSMGIGGAKLPRVNYALRLVETDVP